MPILQVQAIEHHPYMVVGMISLLETLLDNQALCSYGTAHNHPALVIEVAQDQSHPFPDVSEGV